MNFTGKRNATKKLFVRICHIKVIAIFASNSCFIFWMTWFTKSSSYFLIAWLIFRLINWSIDWYDSSQDGCDYGHVYAFDSIWRHHLGILPFITLLIIHYFIDNPFIHWWFQEHLLGSLSLLHKNRCNIGTTNIVAGKYIQSSILSQRERESPVFPSIILPFLILAFLSSFLSFFPQSCLPFLVLVFFDSCLFPSSPIFC